MNGLLVLLLSSGLCIPQPGGKPSNAAGSTSAQELSEAETIARLQRALQEHKDELEKIKKQLEDQTTNPESEYAKVQKAFNDLDSTREAQLKKKAELQGMGKEKELAELEQKLAKLEEAWKQARQRFTLAVQQRKALQEKATTLPDLIQKDQVALDKLLGEKKEEKKPTDPLPKKDEPVEEKKPVEPPPSLPGHPLTPKPPGTPPGSTEPKKVEETPEVRQARQQATAKETEAREAKVKAGALEDRIQAMEKLIEAERKTLEAARQKADLARKTQTELQAEQQTRLKNGAKDVELVAGWEKIGEANQQVQDAIAEVRKATDQLDEYQKQLSTLQAERIKVLKDAEKKSREAELAKKHLADLQNPYTIRNLLQWGINNGPKILGILLGMFLLHIFVRWFSRRIVSLVARRGRRRGRWDQEDRAQTLIGVFRNVCALFIWGGGILMLLDAIHVPIVPLMGGAAIFGLAVAFGAQNLVRDYFTGFMVLMEDQYAVNDCVRIGSVSGIVERISLRMTVLRDLEGIVHFIPHGTISTVSNMSHGWSRALFNIGVAYREDPNRVIEILIDLARQLRQDETFGPMILEDVEMLGVDNFADSAVMIKFYIKTQPMKQWKVKRELLRRVKERFDELGIEIPFPHRTVYHRHIEPGQEDRFAA